ncbi:TadE/TadG family type IV pilus assembly protein [Rhizobium halophytocola]|uniref:Flp pilus assembly protein TadG n=1 Tax=Rhizobium halophytocola TaxID=735519 RepID=A0ABS4E1F5_9HYPH|nr:TadE/TadG family type IV pilus assembly protein [Rhizobium halophytocola]MBP1851746.1 Flp pilus assembly protein TadG [Rhizobium halophytocola]
MRSRDGTAAIEFAILAIPYFLIVFAIIETFVAYSAEQLLTNATNNLARQIRTGEITYKLGRDTDKDKTEFRQLLCNDIAVMITCSKTEAANESDLYVDVQTYTDYNDVPTSIPRVSAADYADIDPTKFKYSPGGPKTVNMVRAFYRWHVMTDLVRPYITNIRPADGSSVFLIVATTTFKNEDYP